MEHNEFSTERAIDAILDALHIWEAGVGIDAYKANPFGFISDYCWGNFDVNLDADELQAVRAGVDEALA